MKFTVFKLVFDHLHMVILKQIYAIANVVFFVIPLNQIVLIILKKSTGKSKANDLI